eukprot:scaffold17580_cov95-Phaeocystis_antarctica.AAC.7
MHMLVQTCDHFVAEMVDRLSANGTIAPLLEAPDISGGDSLDHPVRWGRCPAAAGRGHGQGAAEPQKYLIDRERRWCTCDVGCCTCAQLCTYL